MVLGQGEDPGLSKWALDVTTDVLREQGRRRLEKKEGIRMTSAERKLKVVGPWLLRWRKWPWTMECKEQSSRS